MANFKNETPDETVDRLSTYSERLHQSVSQARILFNCFQSLNENRDLRERINDGPAAIATNVMVHAVLRELIMVLVRVFDRPGRNGVERSDKGSFPVIVEWLARDPIRDVLVHRARNWLDEDMADINEAAARKAMEDMRVRLDGLLAEDPNREKRLRDFRDGFLAHELHREIPRPPLLFGYIEGLLNEATALSEAASMALRGAHIEWGVLEAQITESAGWLWDRVGKPEQERLGA